MASRVMCFRQRSLTRIQRLRFQLRINLPHVRAVRKGPVARGSLGTDAGSPTRAVSRERTAEGPLDPSTTSEEASAVDEGPVARVNGRLRVDDEALRVNLGSAPTSLATRRGGDEGAEAKEQAARTCEESALVDDESEDPEANNE